MGVKLFLYIGVGDNNDDNDDDDGYSNKAGCDNGDGNDDKDGGRDGVRVLRLESSAWVKE